MCIKCTLACIFDGLVCTGRFSLPVNTANISVCVHVSVGRLCGGSAKLWQSTIAAVLPTTLHTQTVCCLLEHLIRWTTGLVSKFSAL